MATPGNNTPARWRCLLLRSLLATDPNVLTQVLAIVYRTLSGYILKKARLTRATGDTGSVTLIQCFGSALCDVVLAHAAVL